MIKLDGFFHTIHKDIGLAVSLKDIMLSLRLRTISFKTYSLTNIFVYRAQSIQFYIKLGHNDRYLDHYSGTKDDGVRGHYGVTGVKKVIFTKKASSPSDYVALTCDLCIRISLTPSTKKV